MQKKVSTLTGIIIIIIAIVIIFGGVFAYQYFSTKTQPVIKPHQQLVGNDRDAHGCIGSAGYSWCAVKNKCLRVWEESCDISSDAYPLFSNLKWSSALPQIIQNITGFQITATDKINTNQDANKFFGYYDNKLKALGWVINNNFAADGIFGSQVGYQKDNNYIILNYTIKPGKITSGANEPLQWTCPCDVTYSIFTK